MATGIVSSLDGARYSIPLPATKQRRPASDMKEPSLQKSRANPPGRGVLDVPTPQRNHHRSEVCETVFGKLQTVS